MAVRGDHSLTPRLRPLTIGLAPLVAIMQTAYLRTRNQAYRRMARLFRTLFVINFAMGVATGLVQEVQFGMNWSSSGGPFSLFAIGTPDGKHLVFDATLPHLLSAGHQHLGR